MMLSLAPCAQVIMRDKTTVQFGLDATTAGAITVPEAARVMAALLPLRAATAHTEVTTGTDVSLGDLMQRLRAATAHTEVTTALVNAGLSPSGARSVVADLVAYRIVVEVPTYPQAVVLLGRTPLAQACTRMFSESGISVRSPYRGESEYNYLSDDLSHTPVLVIDRLAHGSSLAPMLTQSAPTFLPAALVDGRGAIGPLRLHGAGPCPSCSDLHHTERDPRWHRVVSQNPSGPAHPDPALVAATAARICVMARSLLTPPGSTPRE